MTTADGERGVGEVKLLTYPQPHWDALIDREDDRLIVVHETHFELIGKANEDGIDEDKTTKIYFERTRLSWESAWRVARVLANAHRDLIAQISYYDSCNIDRIELGIDLEQACDIEAV